MELTKVIGQNIFVYFTFGRIFMITFDITDFYKTIHNGVYSKL